MAGIVGIIPKADDGNLDERSALDSMVKCLVHESFYRTGTLIHKRMGLFGWISHAGTFSDCMPIWNEEKSICLIFTGEEYREPIDIHRLRASGHDFNPENASYLVHLYEEQGLAFLSELNGGFSGVVLDLRESKVVIFNDRYGLSRIYYHEDSRGFFFSSEAKALLKVCPALRQWDPVGLAEFLSCGCALQNRTLFSGISLVPGGAAWIFSLGKDVCKTRYFQIERWEEQLALSEADYYEKLKETWRRVLPRYFRGNENVALSLTGGVDSRMILAWAPSSPGALSCYTFGGVYRDCADVKVARQVAKICQQPHEIISVADEFFREFSTLAEKTVYLSDGSMDVTGSIDLYVQRKARSIAPVRITGTNGGEILRRLVAFKPTSHVQDLLQPELANLSRHAAETYHHELRGHKLSFTAFKQTPWYMCSKFAVEKMHITLRMPYFDNDLVALSYQTPEAISESNQPALRLIADGNPALQAIGTDRGLTSRSIPGVHKVRHWLQQFTFKAEYAYDYGMPQWLARLDHAVAPLQLEKLFLGRHKFHHFRVYYRDKFSKYVRDILLDPRTRSRAYLQGNRLEAMVEGHLAGYRNHTLELHKLLSIELIERQLLA